MTRFTRVNVSIAQFPEATLILVRPLNLCFIVVFPGCLLVQSENMQMTVDQITSPYYFLSQHSTLAAFKIEMCFNFSASLLAINGEVCTSNSTNSHLSLVAQTRPNSSHCLSQYCLDSQTNRAMTASRTANFRGRYFLWIRKAPYIQHYGKCGFRKSNIPLFVDTHTDVMIFKWCEFENRWIILDAHKCVLSVF